MALLGAFLDLCPDHPHRLLSMALALSSLGRYDDVVRMVGRLGPVAPRWAESHVTAAQVAFDAGMGEQAVWSAAQAEELAPDDWRVVLFHTWMRFANGPVIWDRPALEHQNMKILEWARRAAWLAPDEPAVQMVLGRVYMGLCWANPAVKAFERAVVLGRAVEPSVDWRASARAHRRADDFAERAAGWHAAAMVATGRPKAGLKTSAALLVRHPDNRDCQSLTLQAVLRGVGSVVFWGAAVALWVYVGSARGDTARVAYPWANTTAGAFAAVCLLWLCCMALGLRGRPGRLVARPAAESRAVVAYLALALVLVGLMGAAAFLPSTASHGGPFIGGSPIAQFLLVVYLPLWIAWRVYSFPAWRFLERAGDSSAAARGSRSQPGG